jgi:hypothetical protein
VTAAAVQQENKGLASKGSVKVTYNLELVIGLSGYRSLAPTLLHHAFTQPKSTTLWIPMHGNDWHPSRSMSLWKLRGSDMQVTTSTSTSPSSSTHTCTRMSTYRCCEFGRLCRLSTLLTDRRQRSAQGWDVVGGEAPVQGRAAVAILSSAVQGKEGRLFAWRSQAVASPHALVGHADWKTRNTKIIGTPGKCPCWPRLARCSWSFSIEMGRKRWWRVGT